MMAAGMECFAGIGVGFMHQRLTDKIHSGSGTFGCAVAVEYRRHAKISRLPFVGNECASSSKPARTGDSRAAAGRTTLPTKKNGARREDNGSENAKSPQREASWLGDKRGGPQDQTGTEQKKHDTEYTRRRPVTQKPFHSTPFSTHVAKGIIKAASALRSHLSASAASWW